MSLPGVNVKRGHRSPALLVDENHWRMHQVTSQFGVRIASWLPRLEVFFGLQADHLDRR
jgi:hypothetical protein